jgi:hypothetical protein
MSPVLYRPIATTLLAGLVLTGCGGAHRMPAGAVRSGQAAQTVLGARAEAARSAPQILADARQAASAVTTFRVLGAMHQGKLRFGVDIHYAGTAGAYGSISYNGVSFDVVRIGQAMYFKAPAAFYRQVGSPGRAASAMDGRWIKTAANSTGFAPFANFTFGPQFFTGILGSAASAGMVKVPGSHQVNGTPAVLLRNPADGSRLYLTLQGPPLPIEIRGPHGRGSMMVTGYGMPVSLTPPAGAMSLNG